MRSFRIVSLSWSRFIHVIFNILHHNRIEHNSETHRASYLFAFVPGKKQWTLVASRFVLFRYICLNCTALTSPQLAVREVYFFWLRHTWLAYPVLYTITAKPRKTAETISNSTLQTRSRRCIDIRLRQTGEALRFCGCTNDVWVQLYVK